VVDLSNGDRRFRSVTSRYGRNRFRSTFEQLYLGSCARYAGRHSLSSERKPWSFYRMAVLTFRPCDVTVMAETASGLPLNSLYLGNGVRYEVGVH
jgi:hypothetical protein